VRIPVADSEVVSEVHRTRLALAWAVVEDNFLLQTDKAAVKLQETWVLAAVEARAEDLDSSLALNSGSEAEMSSSNSSTPSNLLGSKHAMTMVVAQGVECLSLFLTMTASILSVVVWSLPLLPTFPVLFVGWRQRCQHSA
jgi:hypothetical protein